MSVSVFHLSSFSPERYVLLRELTGHDEMLVTDNSTACALQLLDSLCVHQFPAKDQRTLKVDKITVADRDYLFAGVYMNIYGTQIESTVHCQACHHPYDVNFSLDDFVKHTRNKNNEFHPDADGFVIDNNGNRFRLPTGEDEMATLGLSAANAAQVILERCLAQPIGNNSEKAIETMEAIAPVLATQLDTVCPECRQEQEIYFDIQSYLLAKLKNDQRRLVAEIHSIAMSYGWSHSEILSLTRSVRQMYAGLINGNR